MAVLNTHTILRLIFALAAIVVVGMIPFIISLASRMEPPPPTPFTCFCNCSPPATPAPPPTPAPHRWLPLPRPTTSPAPTLSPIKQAKFEEENLEWGPLQQSELPMTDFCTPPLRQKIVEGLLLWHIPKCAGSFLLTNLVKQGLYSYDRLTGHTAYFDLHRIGDAVVPSGTPRIIILLIRDPIDRVASEYAHAVRNVVVQNYTRAAGKIIPWDQRSIYMDKVFVNDFADLKVNFSEFVKLGALNPVNNRITRMVSGAVHSYKKNIWETDFSEFLLNVGGSRYRQLRMLHQAKIHLNDVSVIGIADRMAETLELLKLRYNLTFPVTEPLHTNEWSLSAEERRLATVYNDLDVQFYKYAEERFDRDLAKARRCKESMKKGG